MQGLENLGSTCAANSLIQMICRNNTLRNIILRDGTQNNTLSHELREIFDLMHNKNHSLSPKKFIKKLYEYIDIFQIGEQIDICELWMFLFDKLSTEQSKDTGFVDQNIYKIDDINITDNASLSTCNPLLSYCEQTIQKMNNYKSCELLESSQGIFLRMIKCDNCNNVLYNFEPFISIELDIPEEIQNPSITEMFRIYLKTVKCTDNWKCDKCNDCLSYTKILKIWKLPNNLVFVVKRFSGLVSKNTKGIHINQNINIKKGSVICDTTSDKTYECNSIALHSGCLSGGHYCAICKVDEKTILYDDISIQNIVDKNIEKIYDCNKHAYMIFYSMKQIH
jgi:ubiquitin C-terminal hydrolase